jgi:hypothetical protein
MKKLFLDDIRIPKDCANGLVPSSLNKFYWDVDWFIVRSYNEFVNWIMENGLPDFISFDHDLADVHYTIDYSDINWPYSNPDNEKTGYECAKWLGEYCMDNKVGIPNYVVHSQNPVGKMNINSYLQNVKKYS